MKSWSRDTNSGRNREVGTLLQARAQTSPANGVTWELFRQYRAHITLLSSFSRAEVGARHQQQWERSVGGSSYSRIGENAAFAE